MDAALPIPFNGRLVIELGAEQMLQLTFAVDAAAIAAVAGVFLLVLHATRRKRGVGWFWGWTFLAVTFAALSAALQSARLEPWFSFFATCSAIACAWTSIAGAYSFRNEPRIRLWAIVLLVLSSICALLVQAGGDVTRDIVACEIPLAVSVLVQATVLFPMARASGMSGLQTACTVEIVLTAMLGRTLLSAAILSTRAQQLTAAYWMMEIIGGSILCFILAMGELIAILDEVRIELEHANEALNRALAGLEVAAKLDSLTGLYNRYAFYALTQELLEQRKLIGSIAIVDLNGLKRINDTFGHQAGDHALLNTAVRLQQVVRQSDYVFRWGGDEFVLLLFGMAPDAARERLTHMEPPAPLELPQHEPVPLAVSWGVASLGSDLDAALHDADAHLYAQKRLFSRVAPRMSTS